MKKDVLGIVQLITGVASVVIGAITLAKVSHKEDDCVNEEYENATESEESTDETED